MNLIETLKLLRKKERKASSLLKQALSFKRYHQRHLNLDVLKPSDAFYLPAANASARIKWGRIFIREVFDFFAIPHNDIYPSEPVFLVTLSDKSLVTSAEPQKMDLQRMKRKLAGRLRGFNYLGMIEPAYYNSIYDDDGDIARAVASWHGHFLVWGIEQEVLAKHVKNLNGKFEAVMLNFAAAHQKQIEYGQFGYTLWYIVKSPCKEYSVGRRSKPGEETGKSNFKHNKRDIRLGARVKMFHLMKPLYLDQLAMAGGEGREPLYRIKTAALREYRERNGWEETRP